jgi:hypothetical protein
MAAGHRQEALKPAARQRNGGIWSTGSTACWPAVDERGAMRGLRALHLRTGGTRGLGLVQFDVILAPSEV